MIKNMVKQKIGKIYKTRDGHVVMTIKYKRKEHSGGPMALMKIIHCPGLSQEMDPFMPNGHKEDRKYWVSMDGIWWGNNGSGVFNPLAVVKEIKP